MKCREVRDRLSAFADGELEGDERKAIASHLEHCDSCSHEYGELLRLADLLSSLETVEPPPYLWQRVIQRVAKPERTTLWERVAHKFVYAPVAAAILIGVFVGNHLGETMVRTFTVEDTETLTLSSLDDCPPGSFSDVYFSAWEE